MSGSDPWTILGIPQSTWMSGTFVPTPQQWDTLFSEKADFTTSFVGTFSGPLTGNVNGNVTGALTGNVTGNVTGNLTGNVSGNVAGILTGSVAGVTDGSNAAAGMVGEWLTASRSTGIASASATIVDIASLPLSAGDWDVQGNVQALTGASGLVLLAWLNTVSVTAPLIAGAGQVGFAYISAGLTTTSVGAHATGRLRINSSASPTVYLSGSVSGAGAQLTGFISARRMR
jgi:hypothetical protein